jgi:hypothetical protein
MYGKQAAMKAWRQREEREKCRTPGSNCSEGDFAKQIGAIHVISLQESRDW